MIAIGMSGKLTVWGALALLAVFAWAVVVLGFLSLRYLVQDVRAWFLQRRRLR